MEGSEIVENAGLVVLMVVAEVAAVGVEERVMEVVVEVLVAMAVKRAQAPCRMREMLRTES